MEADDVRNTFETGECLLVAQEVKGKSDVRKVMGNTGDQEKEGMEQTRRAH